jgi:hypothetical protein
VYPWDPFFGESTSRVLTSDISKAFPVSDAGLGALSYLLDALAGLIGGRRRWRTMPWMVVLFGEFIIPPGVTSIVLDILQPVSIGAWCTLCLVASVVMLLMVSPALDEVIATGQFLLRTRRERGHVWRAFWRGEGSAAEEPESLEKRSRLSEILHSIEVFSAPSNLWLSALVGAWLMAAPTLLGLAGAAADSTHIMGALVVTFSVVAFAEPARLVRWLNVLFGLWVLLAPWLLGGARRPGYGSVSPADSRSSHSVFAAVRLRIHTAAGSDLSVEGTPQIVATASSAAGTCISFTTRKTSFTMRHTGIAWTFPSTLLTKDD